MFRTLCAVLTAALVTTMSMTPLAIAAPTSPDPGFDGDGILVIHSDVHDEFLADMTALGTGKTMLLVLTQDEPAIELYRLRKDGSPDPTFGGGDGVVPFGLAAGYENVTLAVDPITGKSYVTTFLDGGVFPTTVWRFKADGTLDSAYGGSGTGHVIFNQQVVQGLAPGSGGRLLMVGNDFAGNTANVWRLTNDGALDPNFGTAGSAVLTNEANDTGSGVAIQPDGKVVVATDHYSPTASTLRAYRLTRGGDRDVTFSGDGKATIDPSSPGVTTSTVWSPDVLLRPDGRTVFVAGLNQNDGVFRNALLVAGLTATGRPDPRFGKHVYTGVAETWGGAALERDGKVLVAGSIPPSPSTHNAVVRFTSSGKFDRTWSGDGILRLSGQSDLIRVGISPDGRVLVGRTVNNSPYDTEVRALRGTKTPLCHGKLATQFGSSKSDTIEGTSRTDVLVGLGGNDVVRGSGGKDLICGSAGSDKLLGGTGPDALYGQGGSDLLVGGHGKDTLVGGPGKDTVKR